MNNECADPLQTVMQTCRLAGIEAHSPTITYVANREVSNTDVKGGQQMI
jgi:hypothetical protein